MKIAVIGSGGWGTALAIVLHNNGHQVTLWSHTQQESERLDHARENPFLKGVVLPDVIACTSDPACVRGMGMVVMATPSFAVRQTAMRIAPYLEPETVVVSLQNGLGNDEVLAQFVETDRILYGSGLIGTELAGPGVCVSKPEKGIQMHFGAVHNNPKADAAGKALEACFQAGGCNASFDEDVRPYIWKKVIANSGYNGVSAVMRLKVKETFADPYGHDIVMHVWKEGCAVAQALGIGDLWPLMEKEEPNIIANLGNYYPSMAQDAVLHQRQTEISVLNGAIARYGERLGVPTPFNTVITKVISCIQNNYDKQYLG